ncbi:MAG: hypothetical protein WCA44_08370 [Acidobacteriaceae bacterium]
MDETKFKETVDRLNEVNDVISKLDASIRAEAFALLRSYVSGHPAHPPGPVAEDCKGVSPSAPLDAADAETFFTAHSGESPSDNVFSIAAYLYSQYGTAAFSKEDLQKLADETGLTIPNRPDTTITSATREGKALFTRVGKGRYKPTVHGEAFLKTTYSVKKGVKQPPSGDGE